MVRGWRLGGRWFAAVQELSVPEGSQGASWWVVRRDADGSRHLLQLWEPLPPPKALDGIRGDFLGRFTRAEPMDPTVCHLGFDDKCAWFLQDLEGLPFLRIWEAEDAAGREGLLDFVREAMGRTRAPRLLAPEVIGLKPGLAVVPRVLGTAPWGHDGLLSLPESEPGAGGGARVWEQPPDLVEAEGAPVRGRSQELTYLKSLMFGLSAAAPMERVVLLQGEDGLGHDRLCDWAAAAAETEGLWVSDVELLQGEGIGSFFERVLQGALEGMEADFYAADPAMARALARRMETFAFLRGGRRPGFADRKLEVEEMEAALGALAFAQERHRRLFVLRGMERVTPALLDLVKGLMAHSKIPWLLSFRGTGTCTGLRSFLESAKNSPATATVILDRLEDAFLPEILADRIGAGDLPPAFVAEACQACLGNPGLLHSLLEMAILKGALVWEEGRWRCPEGERPKFEVQGGEEILEGRLARLAPQAVAAAQILAVAETFVTSATLARILGLDADGAEAPLHAVVNAKLALVGDGGLRIAGEAAKSLVLARTPQDERAKLARSLVRTLEEEGRRPALSVRLQACARDPKAALAQVIAAIDREAPGPEEAVLIVTEALALGPGPSQEARLWEFLSDAWCLGPEGERLPWEAAVDRSPYLHALEALGKGLRALGEPRPGDVEEEQAARLLRKQAFLEIRLRRFTEAHQSIRKAAACLADHPFHAEQPRLRLALGRLHQAQGAGAKAARALEEGLQLLVQKGAGAGHQDHVALLVEMGKLQGQRAQFQHSVATLQSAKRFLEHEGDRRRLVGVLDGLGQVHQGLGQMTSAYQYLYEALGLARAVDDLELKAACHLDLGVLRSCQQLLGPALAHTDSALRRYQAMGDRSLANRALVWKARTLAALGDGVQAEFLLLKASEVAPDLVTPQEHGDMAFLGGEIAAFRDAWRDARRSYLEAANRFGEGGYVWRERLARLRCIQAETLEAGAHAPEAAWVHLERIKGAVEGTGSRWLDMEWHKAHALLLSRSGPEEAVIAEALTAWGEVVALAREMKVPGQVLEAETCCSTLLLARGERLGARSRIQDALPAFQELWSGLPDHFENYFLGRGDIHRFKEAVEATGLRFILPAKVDPLADWSPTQANLPLVPLPRVNP
jgi:tetratricopeptide (TPR) repeat protein